MTDAEEFILSIYKLIKELSITNISKVCLVRNTINNKQYIMRILPKDCRPVYSVLKNSLFSGVPTIYEVIYNGNTTIVEEYIEGTPLSDIAQSTISYESFSNYIWSFTKGQTVYEEYTLRITSPLSDEISKDLKKRGMTFVGSTIIYSYLQAIGIINGHSKWCMCYRKTTNEG